MTEVSARPGRAALTDGAALSTSAVITGVGVGVLASGNRKGLKMDRCAIEYNMDDGISLNVHGRLFRRYPNESIGDYRIAEFSPGPPWHKGDSVQLFDPATGAADSYTIDTVVPEDAFADVTVLFTTQAPGMYTGTYTITVVYQ